MLAICPWAHAHACLCSHDMLCFWQVCSHRYRVSPLGSTTYQWYFSVECCDLFSLDLAWCLSVRTWAHAHARLCSHDMLCFWHNFIYRYRVSPLGSTTYQWYFNVEWCDLFSFDLAWCLSVRTWAHAHAWLCSHDMLCFWHVCSHRYRVSPLDSTTYQWSFTRHARVNPRCFWRCWGSSVLSPGLIR